MSKSNPVENAGAVLEKSAVSANSPAPKFSVERLGKNCRQLFGVSSCAYAGATHGLSGEYTVDEMKAHIESWRKKEVK